eukprot:TRINITY_DN4365_c1_g1_i1.p1 TRINITY_DN4365_c1_g1~~TRINITY_DN4365_c1_g1_i1.p1  ORF type:complete len:1085 (-),score=179.47 TRINITY_DN4365_c1_g1_i1:58-3312(-)
MEDLERFGEAEEQDHDDAVAPPTQCTVLVPSLRGGFLSQALKQIMKLTGAEDCALNKFDDGEAEVHISGAPSSVSDCEEAVERAVRGDYSGLKFTSDAFAVSDAASDKLEHGTAAHGRSPAQALGDLTGCDLFLEEGQVRIVGPSAAVVKGARSLTEKFASSDSDDLDIALGRASASDPDASALSTAEQMKARAAALRTAASSKPTSSGPSRKVEPKRLPLVDRVVQVPNLSKHRLLSCNGLAIRKVQDVSGVKRISVLRGYDEPEGLPPNTLALKIAGTDECIVECESILFQIADGDCSAIGHVASRLLLTTEAFAELLGTKPSDLPRKRTLVNTFFTNWRDASNVHVSFAEEDTGTFLENAASESVVEIVLSGEEASVERVKVSLLALLALMLLDKTAPSASSTRYPKVVSELFRTMRDKNVKDLLEQEATHDDEEVFGGSNYALGLAALSMIRAGAIARLLGLVGNRYHGGVIRTPEFFEELREKRLSNAWQAGDEDLKACALAKFLNSDRHKAARQANMRQYVIECTVLLIAFLEEPIPVSPADMAGFSAGDCVSFHLAITQDGQVKAVKLEHAAWQPPIQEKLSQSSSQPGGGKGVTKGGAPVPCAVSANTHPSPPAPPPPQVWTGHPPVIEKLWDEQRGHAYFWNHTEGSASWTAPPPHVGYWDRVVDQASGRQYFVNPGTHQTVWELPLARPTHPLVPAASTASKPPVPEPLLPPTGFSGPPSRFTDQAAPTLSQQPGAPPPPPPPPPPPLAHAMQTGATTATVTSTPAFPSSSPVQYNDVQQSMAGKPTAPNVPPPRHLMKQSHPSTTSPPSRPPPPPPQVLRAGRKHGTPGSVECSDAADATDDVDDYFVDETDGITGSQQKLEEDDGEISMDRDELNRTLEEGEEETNLHKDVDESGQEDEEAGIMDEEVPWEDREPGWSRGDEEDLDDENVKRKMMDELDNLRRACQTEGDGEVQPDEVKFQEEDDDEHDAVARPVSRPKGKAQPPDRPPTQWQRRLQNQRAAPGNQSYSGSNWSKRKSMDNDDWQDYYESKKYKSSDKPKGTDNTCWKDEKSVRSWNNPAKKHRDAPWAAHL